MPGMTKKEREAGFVYISQVVSKETHGKMLQLCKNRDISMKDLVQKLCNWAGENYDNPVHLIRSGVDLPIWASDREKLTSLFGGGGDTDKEEQNCD